MISKFLPVEQIPLAFIQIYSKHHKPESHLYVLFYQIPFSDEYFLKFPEEGWRYIDLSCYNVASIRQWIEQRIDYEI